MPYEDTSSFNINEFDDSARRGMAGLYGDQFPLIKATAPEEKDWASWAKNLWDSHSASVQYRLHLVQRNRLFRRGVQWISAIGLGPWREPPKPRDAARVVRNCIRPALDQRVQLIAENHPGFKTRPQTLDPNDVKRAEAQQLLLEYQYDQQGLPKILEELAYWAGTDGVAFGEVYWDANAGPWDETQGPVGDIKCCVRRIEQVRVSANATTNEKPWYWIVREVMPLGQAVHQYGSGITDDIDFEVDYNTVATGVPMFKMGYQLPDGTEMFRDQKLVDRLTIYCERSEFLPQGLTLIVVGKKVVFQGPLLMGRVPIFRFTDGSSDPSFFCEPIMDSWIDPQMRINAVLSKWVENVRYNAGPRLLAKQHSIVGETLTGGTMTVIDVKGLGDVSSNVKTLEGMSLAPDAQALLQMDLKFFEDLSGWNDTSRGSFSADQSGRAILAIREQLERIFAPPVNAACKAMTDWAKITLGWAQWGYDVPRLISVTSSGRPDLARTLSSQDINGAVDVWIDPETLMPMPRALRMFLLDNMLDRQIITPQEYRQRHQFALVRNMQYPDEEHEARARRVAEAIRQTGQAMVLPILWQDNEAIHQDVLERELILQDDIDQMVRSAAFERWMMLAQQQQMKAQGMMPPTQMPGGGQQPAPPPHSQQPQIPPAQTPLAGTNPSVASANAAAMSGPDENRTARAFDQMPH